MVLVEGAPSTILRGASTTPGRRAHNLPHNRGAQPPLPQRCSARRRRRGRAADASRIGSSVEPAKDPRLPPCRVGDGPKPGSRNALGASDALRMLELAARKLLPAGRSGGPGGHDPFKAGVRVLPRSRELIDAADISPS